MTPIVITRAIARKVLKVVDAGLTTGKGRPIPGHMCVEAAVCSALGLPHSDDPRCVSEAVRQLKITLNDAYDWLSRENRAQGLRRLALAQLGTSTNFDSKEFAARVLLLVRQNYITPCIRVIDEYYGNGGVLRLAQFTMLDDVWEAVRGLSLREDSPEYRARQAIDHIREAVRHDIRKSPDSAAAYATAALVSYAKTLPLDERPVALAKFAEEIVQILIDLKAEGCQWLDLAPLQ